MSICGSPPQKKNEHVARTAEREEPPMLAVDSESCWPSSRRNRPARFDRQRLTIDRDEFVLVLDIVVNRALAIGNSELGRSSQIDRTHDAPCLGIDHS